MTIYYLPSWLINGGPPMPTVNCPQIELAPDGQPDGIAIIFQGDEWHVVDLNTDDDGIVNVLADYHANQFHKILSYVSEYLNLRYNLEAQLIRPEQDRVHTEYKTEE